MDIKYLKLRLNTFRREYFDISSNWFNQRVSWLWQFTIDNFKFLYRGEIHQIKYLTAQVNQQKFYIEDLESGKDSTECVHTGNLYDTKIDRYILLLLKIVLIPVSFIIYWIRRIIRIIKRESFIIHPSAILPTEDYPLYEDYSGDCGSLFLLTMGETGYPRGLVILRFTAAIKKGSPQPVLYIDPGTGFSENFTIPLPFNEKDQMQELLLEFPPHCKNLKLKLSDLPIEYEIQDFSITETSFFLAAWYLHKRYQFGVNEILHALFIRKMPGVRRPQSYKSSYAEWHNCYGKLSKDDKSAISNHIKAMDIQPKLSIITRVDTSSSLLLRSSLNSISKQIYKNWELLILCDNPPDPHITAVINEFDRNFSNVDIVIDKNLGKISGDINHAIPLINGNFVVLLEPTDILTEHALYLIANTILTRPDTKLIYSDFDLIDQYGQLSCPTFKTEWNYDLFLSKNYIQYLTCYECDVFKKSLASSKTDIVTNSSELNILCIEELNPEDITHIPYVLLHHRQFDNQSDITRLPVNYHCETALNNHLAKTEGNTTTTKTEYGHRVIRQLPKNTPLVSLIILTRDRVALLSNCVDGILSNTDYKNLEIIIVDNGSQDKSTLDYLESLKERDNITILREDREFNFSELNNIAVKHSQGDYIGLINNDISIIRPDWLDEMMSHICREDVGAVGAKLLYEDGTVQHAGVTIGLGGVAGHSLRFSPGNYRGYDDRLVLTHEVSCVTAACLLTKRALYDEVDGLNEINLKVAFNDVDYSLKVREKGYKVILTPFAKLYHLESASRGSDLSRENIHRWNAEYTYMRDNWANVLDKDPFYNPNLTIVDEDFSLAIPPRLIHPWSKHAYQGK